MTDRTDMRGVNQPPTDPTTSGQDSTSISRESTSLDGNLSFRDVDETSTTQGSDTKGDKKFPAWNTGERIMGAISTMGQKTIASIGSPIRWAVSKASEGASEPKLSKAERKIETKSGEVQEMGREIATMKQDIHDLNRSWRQTGSISTRESAEKLEAKVELLEKAYDKALGELNNLQGTRNNDIPNFARNTLTLPFLGEFKW